MIMALIVLSFAMLMLSLSIDLSVQFIVVILKSIFYLNEGSISIIVALFYGLRIGILYVLSATLTKFQTTTSKLLLYAALGSLAINFLLLLNVSYVQWFTILWLFQALSTAFLLTSAYPEALSLLKERAYLFGLFRGVMSSDYILAPLIAGLVIEHWRLYGLISIAITLALFSLLLLTFYIFTMSPHTYPSSANRGKLNFKRLLERSFPRFLWLALLLEGMGLGIFIIAFPLLLLSKGFSYSEIGAIEASTSLLSPFSSVVGGMLTKMLNPLALASIGLTIGAVATISYVYLGKFIEYLIVAAIASIGFSLFFTSWPIAYRHIYGEVRADDMALIFLAFDLGSIMGAYIGGPLFSAMKSYTLILDSALVVLASITLISVRVTKVLK